MFSVDSIVNGLTVGFLSLIVERMRQNCQHGLLTGGCVGGGAGYSSIPFPQQRTPHSNYRGHHGPVSKRTGASSLSQGDPWRCEKVLCAGHWKDPTQAFTRFWAETTRCLIVFGHTSRVALGRLERATGTSAWGGKLRRSVPKRVLVVKHLHRPQNEKNVLGWDGIAGLVQFPLLHLSVRH